MSAPTEARTIPPLGLRPAEMVLAIGGLFIGTAEFASMGLLPDMAGSLGISVPHAGSLISSYALGVVIGSPILAVVTARMERRRLLILLAVLVCFGNAASALATNFELLLAARFLAGLPHGTYYGVASVVIASMVPMDRRTAAIGRVMLGLAAANLIGVPLTTLLGQWLGWRAAFGMIAAGGVIVALLLPLAIPRMEADRKASPLRELSALGRLQVWLTLGTAAIGFGGMFAVYSYITPTLTELAGQPAQRVPLFLALWGLGMVIGNIAGAWLADRMLNGAIVGLLVWNAAFLGLFSLTAGVPLAAAATLLLIGNGFALVPALQARLMDVAPDARSLAAALNHSAFNLSNAIGAWTGGAAIAAGYGWASTGVVAGILALGGLAIFILALAIQARAATALAANP